MGLQGNKATHDFLSLYTSATDSSFQLQDSKPPPSQGFFLKTHDFLQPLERAEEKSAAVVPPPASDVISTGERRQQHVLPGGIGTFSISHAAAGAAGVRAAAVKNERNCDGAPFALWAHPAVEDPGSGGGGGGGGHWSLPFAARGGDAPRQQQQQPVTERKGGAGFMDAASRSSRGAGFDDDDLDTDDFAARREVSSSLKELSVRVEGKGGGGSCSGSGTEQRPNTPRSKHSATEQRRRSKINDRFQILRELLPHSDQKRDKASFLLEVIEYIRFLQEKVQKYEVSYPEWNQENAKIMPWANIYFRSFWKNAQNKGQIQGDGIPDPSQVVKNGSSPGCVYPGKFDDNNIAVASAAASGAHDRTETDPMASVSYRSAETPTNFANNVTPQAQAQWARMSGADDCAVSSGMLNDQELTIDEGTISLSSQYSQELLTTLNQALQNSGIDLSQASISVQINLGKRAGKRSATGATSGSKELKDPSSANQAVGHLRLGDNAEELSHAPKRHKSDNT